MWKPPETNKKEWEMTEEPTGNTSSSLEAPQLLQGRGSRGGAASEIPLLPYAQGVTAT